MTTERRRSTGRTIGRGSLLFLLLSGTALTPLHSAVADDALPTGGRFTAGSGRIAEQAGGLRIDQGSRTGIVEWQGFSIGAGKSVHIDNGAGATLNRVTGTLPSRIDGSLTATGSAYLVNRAGIVVGKEGRVATGGSFIASTHDVPDAAFAAQGDLTFAGTSKAAVVNMGTIASRGGDVALIARSVRNEGTIAAPKGTAALAAGYEVLAKEKADADGRFVVKIGGADTEAVNAGTLAAANAEMRANGGNLYALAGNTGGLVKATGAATRDGRVFLTAGDGGAVTVDSPVVAQRRSAEAGPKPDRPTPEVRESGRRDGAAKRPPRSARRPEVSGGDIRVSGESVRIAGMLDASGTAGRGGTLVATGGTVVLSGTAVLDVSGTAGGTLLVGGDYQGGRNAATRYLAEPVARARALTVEAGAQLRADGTRGDGGRVVLWSDRDTAFAGTISARGAVRGGDAEVSGKARLAFTGTADLRGTAGFGTLLLDPYNLTISDAADSGMSGFSASGNDSVLNVNTLKSALGWANVLVTTGDGGTQAGDITMAAPLTWNASTTLTLSAYRDITVNAALTAQGDEGMIVLKAGRDIAVNAAVTGETRSDVSLLATRDVAVNAAVSGAKVVLWSDYGGIGTGTVRFGAGATITASGGASILYNPTVYTAPTDYSGIAGAGTVVTGYMLVNTAENLQAIGTNLAGVYALGRDIDADATAGWNHGAGFAPLGSAATPFTGLFDGRDHAINGLTINRADSDDVGLFGVVGTGGAVRDVRMVGGSVLGANRVGALAGSNAGTVTWASATGTVTGRGGEVGGLVGSNAGTVGQSFATGAVTAQGGAAGGLVGSSSGTILQTYASGAVTAGGDQVGGLVGRVTAGSVTEAYALGSVTGTRSVGGLIGDNGGAVTESYATGAVTGQDAGGLIGANGGTVEWSFWDTQTTGLGSGVGVGNGTTTGLRGLTSDEIRDSSAVADGNYFSYGAYKWYSNLFDIGPDFRPIGVWEAARTGADGYRVVSNLHQLVLINATDGWTEYPKGSYRLAMDIDASETAGTNPAGIWGERGFYPIGNLIVRFQGNFDGDGHVIKGLFINRPNARYVGFFGQAIGVANNNAIIKNIGITDGQFTGEVFVGGLVGSISGGVVIENSYFTGSVSGQSIVGGLVGNSQSPLDRIKQSYAVASVTAAGNRAGGLVGRSYAGIDQSYASGSVTGATNVGGFIGEHTQGTITNSYWDTQTSGQQNGVGNKVVTGLTGLTTAEARQASSYVGWDFAKDWYQSADMRPIGRWEAAKPGSDGVATVTNLHQFQLIDANPTGSYRLGADIDAQATSGVDAAGVWGAGGFTPLGTGVAGFTGRFDGRGHLIRGLTVNRPTSDDVGLFGRIGTGGSVGYVGLDATSTVTGRDRVGAIAGWNGGILLQSFSWAGVSGQGLGTGGLVGLNTATIHQSYATGAVTGQGDGVGGLVGDNNAGGSIAQSYATGAVTGQGLGTGGLVGNNGAGSSIAQSYATGAVSGQGAALGGLVGRNDGTTTLSYWNTQTSGMAAGAGAGSVTGVTGLDSAGMRDASSFTGFDRMVWAPADGTDAPLLYGVSGVVGVVQSAVYGDDPQTVPVSLLGGWAWSRVTGSASSTLAAGTNVGTYLSFLDTSGVAATFSAGGAARVVNVGAVVTPATLTVTAANGTMVYGDTVPSLGYTTSGWKNGQSGALLSGVTVSTSATALSDIGDYASTATGGVLSGAAEGNYTIFHTTGTVSITPATLTVTAANGTMVYGDTVPSLGYATSGWKNGQSGALLSAVAVSTDATVLSDVGNGYVTTATGGTLSGAAAGNYTFSYIDGAFSVTPAALTVTAANGTMVYGDAVPSLSYATSGWKNGQSGALLSGVTVSTNATTLSDVGSAYTTTATGGTLSGAAAGNYTLSYVNGAFSVTPATLTVTAANGTMVYGDAVPALGYTTSGWKNGQSGALLSAVGVSTNATSLSNVGSAYTTTATGGTLSGAAAGNYTLSHVGGTFAVTPATLTVTAADGAMVYGDAVPSLGYTTSGWRNGQGDALLSGVTVSTSATALSDVGDYANTATGGILSGAAAGNYTFSYVNGAFSVTPAVLMVTAANGTMAYGDAVPSLGYSVSGWRNGQNGALLSGVGVSTNATSLSNAGTAYITTATGGVLSGAAAGNYTLAHLGGAFSVTPATLTVTAADGTMVYGDAVPALGYTTSGWRNGQGDALISGIGVSTAVTSLSNAGAYVSTVTGGVLSGAAVGNYSLSHVTGTVTVTPAPLTVTAANGTMVYGDAVPSLGYGVSGWRNGQSDALLSGVIVSTNATALSNVGAYASAATGGTLSGAAAGNYTLSHVGGTFAVTPATLTVTAGNGTMVYGDAVPSLGYSVSGWKNGQGDALLSGVGVSTNATSLSNVGNYASTATGGTLSGAAAGNYTLNHVNGVFSVSPATLTVTAANGTMVYGDAVPSLGYTTSGWRNGQSDALLSAVAASTNATTLSNVGIYTSTATGGTLLGAAAGNYTLSHATGTVTITPAPLTVTAADGTMVYGDAVPSLGYSVSGWKKGQGDASLSGISVSASATSVLNVGAYTTTATGGTLSGVAAGNYTLSYVNGSFAVTPATLTVTAANGTMIYGDTVPSLSYTISGWKNGQSDALLSGITVSSDATSLSDVGTAYITTATGGTLAGAATGNYTISHVGGSFSVTPAALTVTAGNGTMVYGDAVPSLGYTSSGWKNGQSGALLSAVAVSTNATTLSDVGSAYVTTATGGTLSGSAAGNYTLSHVGGTLSVTPATLTVTAANGTMVYGDALPSLGYSVAGWRNSQSDALLSGVTVSTDATSLSNVGVYASTAAGGTLSGAATGNYVLRHVDGSFSVTPATLTVIAANGAMVYGDTAPSLGYTTSGWRNGQGDALLSGVTVSTDATSLSNVGLYTSSTTGGLLSGAAAGNYTLSRATGTVTITPATLTVTAANGTMVYGDAAPTLGYGVSGWRNGQSDALLSGVTVSTNASSLSDVGTSYLTTATGGALSGAAVGNYTLSYVGGSLSVTPAVLTVTAANGAMVYGDAVPSLGYTSSGWKNGQSDALLSGIGVSTDATTLSDVGAAYTTTAMGGTLAGAAAGNYTLAYVGGAFSVTPAALTVTAGNGTMVYGDAVPSLGYAISGWKNGQGDALLSGIGVSTDATSLSNVGNYASTATGGTLSGAAAGNYTLNHVNGAISVTPATLTVTAGGGSMIYGDAVPSLSYTTAGWRNGQSGALLSGVTVSTDATSLSNVGAAYTTTATGGTLSGAAVGNYRLSYVDGAFSVTPAALMVTAANGTMVYGDAVPSLGYSVSGWKNGQSGALLSGVGISTDATSLSNVGTSYLTMATGGVLSGGATGNYTLAYVGGAFSVTPATLTVTAADATMIYGENVPALGYTTSGWKNGQGAAMLSGIGVFTGATSLSNVGTYASTATGGTLSGAAAGNYTLSHVGGTVLISPAPLTVTAGNGAMVYGDAVPSLGYSVSGWKNGQGDALLSGVTVSTNATALSDVGSAYLTSATGGTLSGAAAGNYTLSYVNGAFSVTPAVLTVTAANSTMAYGDAVPSLGYSVSGWRNGQNGALLSGVGVSTNATSLSNAGTAYITTATGGVLSGAAAGNYTLAHLGGTFAVTPAALTVTAGNGMMVYGENVPSLGYTTSGWKNGQGDALISGIGVSTAVTSLSNAGAYVSTVTGGVLSGAAVGNYSLSHVAGTVTVTPAPLTVTAANGTMVYGDAVPSLGYGVSGWRNGQSDALLSGVIVSTNATALSNVGAYASAATGGTLSGAAAGNYTLSHVGGTFSVTPATLTVTAANGTMVYGDAVPSLGYTTSGWKNGQGDALLSGVDVSTSATALSSVGRYVSTATGGVLSGDAAGNYTLRYVDGHLMIVQRPPVVVVDDPSRPAGTANPPSTDRPTASDPRATPGVPVELPPPSGIAAFLPARFIDPVAPSPAAPPVAGRSGSEAGSPGPASEQDGGGDGTQDACGAAGGEGCATLPHPANRVLGTFLSVKSP
ncbi:MBG domain-containing protein [Azospirillum argentinense]|uniref:MBG domain-containing protein n=1 Tax=Azospirillum argentinense TaxID=2970906 RepID=UPI001586781D|nr:MBG domain-containing protein [Azospirillum argentinense]